MKTQGIFALSALIFVAHAGGAESTPPRFTLPSQQQLEEIFRPLRFDRATLSRSGRFVAYIDTAAMAPAQAIVIKDLTAPESAPLTIAAGRDVSRMEWSADDQLVFQGNLEDKITLSRNGFNALNVGDQLGRRATEIRIFDPLTKSDRVLADTEIVGQGGRARRPMLSGLTPDGATALVHARSQPFSGTWEGFYAIDLRSGKRTRLADSGFTSDQILADQTGMPRTLLPVTSPQSVQFSEGKGKGWYPLGSVKPPLAVKFRTELTNYFADRELPVAFGANPDILYYASNVNRNTFGLYALNVRTKSAVDFKVEDPAFDLVDFTQNFPGDNLIWDRFTGQLAGIRVNGIIRQETRWLDQELAGLQRQFSEKFPQGTVSIINWDKARRRFLLLTSDEADPGSYHLYDREKSDYLALLRKEPSPNQTPVVATSPFSIHRPDGSELTGYILKPEKRLPGPIHALIVLHDGPWDRFYPGYDQKSQALAAMGFVVVNLNYTGSSGFGAKSLRDLQARFDTLPFEEIRETIDWLTREKIATGKIALMGTGFGGYLALKMQQVQPDGISCVVALDPIIDLDSEVTYLRTVNFTPPKSLPVPVSAEEVRAQGGLAQAVGARGGAGGSRPDLPGTRKRLFRHALADYFQKASTSHEHSLWRKNPAANCPLLIIQGLEPQRRGEWSSAGQDMMTASATALSLPGEIRSFARTAAKGQVVDHLEAKGEFDGRDPKTTAEVYHGIEQFLAEHVYGIGVKFSPLRVVPDK